MEGLVSIVCDQEEWRKVSKSFYFFTFLVLLLPFVLLFSKSSMTSKDFLVLSNLRWRWWRKAWECVFWSSSSTRREFIQWIRKTSCCVWLAFLIPDSAVEADPGASSCCLVATFDSWVVVLFFCIVSLGSLSVTWAFFSQPSFVMRECIKNQEAVKMMPTSCMQKYVKKKRNMMRKKEPDLVLRECLVVLFHRFPPVSVGVTNSTRKVVKNFLLLFFELWVFSWKSLSTAKLVYGLFLLAFAKPEQRGFKALISLLVKKCKKHKRTLLVLSAPIIKKLTRTACTAGKKNCSEHMRVRIEWVVCFRFMRERRRWGKEDDPHVKRGHERRCWGWSESNPVSCRFSRKETDYLFLREIILLNLWWWQPLPCVMLC